MWLAENWSVINPLLMFTSVVGIIVCSILLLQRDSPSSDRQLRPQTLSELEKSLELFIDGQTATHNSSLFMRKLDEEFKRYQEIERGFK